jgi:hypothetical protein
MGTQLSKDKFFNQDLDAQKNIPSLLNSKYLYVDNKSSVMVTYNSVSPYDTTTVSSSNKYTLVDDDYTSMGTASGTPGQFKNFSSSINPDFYLAIWLKKNFPYAKSGDVKLIRYKFYGSGATTLVAGVYTFDGANWIANGDVNSKVAKFTFKDKIWQYIDADILIGLNQEIGDFTTVNVSGDQVWAWDSYGYMKMTGYVSGTYLDNEDWLISPAMNLTERSTPWLTFMHVGRYFGDSGTSTEKMRNAITVWASTKSDGTSIKASDWTQLTIPEAGYPTGADWKLISSTPVDLKEFAGKDNVRIAFRYMSSSADNAAGTWEVKDVYVFEE